MSKRVFFLAMFAGMLGFLLMNSITKWSSSHAVLVFRQIRFAETNEVSDDKQIYAFHKPEDAHIYMVARTQVKNTDGYWEFSDNSMMPIEELEGSGGSFIAFADSTDTYERSYLIVCTSEVLETAEEVENAEAHGNHVWFDAAGVPVKPYTITCN